jgi:hypothetical protein
VRHIRVTLWLAPKTGHSPCQCLRSALWTKWAFDKRSNQIETFYSTTLLRKSILDSQNEEEAVKTAKGIDFGLVAPIWSKDCTRQMRPAKRLRAGQVFINNYGAGGGVELPFGGVGLSGHGREKGFEALYCFSTLETVAAHHG